MNYIKYAWDNIKHRKLRSFLTVLSILIGIASIFTLVSFGQGLTNYIDVISSEVGTDKLIIQSKGIGAPGTDENFFIKKEEVEFLSKINGMDEVAGVYFSVVQIKHDRSKKFVFMGSENMNNKKLIMELYTLKLHSGRDLKKGDNKKVVMGYNYLLPKKIYETSLRMRDKIKINDEEFQIIGFYEPVGNPQDDSNIYITNEGFEILMPEKKNKFQFAIARVQEGINPKDMAEKAALKLRKFKSQKEGDEDFFIMTYEQLIQTFNNILGVINGVLVLIALISLVVAGVNIMNTMYTAVLERTKEIGILKAIGAKNNNILMIFLVESGIVGLFGGILGISLGWGISTIGGRIAADAGYQMLQPIFPVELIIGCLVFALLVGIISGLMPARQASKLLPVDALRYE